MIGTTTALGFGYVPVRCLKKFLYRPQKLEGEKFTLTKMFLTEEIKKIFDSTKKCFKTL